MSHQPAASNSEQRQELRIADRISSAKLTADARFRLGRLRNRMRSPFFWPHKRLAVKLGWGSLPDFIVIGVQKGGTKSLYEYLSRHPEIRPARRKEVHYFDLNFYKGLDWYRSYFPLSYGKEQDYITGEASPYYVFHPHVPERIAGALSSVKLILLLRSPVDRAYSHFQHNIKFGIERGSFESALARESEVLPAETRALLARPDYNSHAHRHYSYLARGVYSEQVDRWLKVFAPERLLVLKSEQLFSEPAVVFRRVLEFLNLSAWEPAEWRAFNKGSYQYEMRQETRGRLSEFFRPHNQRLAELIEIDTSDWS